MPYPVDWFSAAACRAEDPELFFPPTTRGPSVVQAARAKSVCAGCPVRVRCLNLALENGLDYGIFGGYTEHERRALLRRTAGIGAPRPAAERAARSCVIGRPNRTRSLRRFRGGATP